MAKKKYSSRSETGESLAKDDLQLINGVGPAVEKRLNGIGIYTFSQLAALSPADIAAAIADLSGLSTERIIKQDWIGQARELAADLVASEEQQNLASVESKNSVVPSKGQNRAATFTIEFLLDEENNVYTTHVLHIESKRECTWTGQQKIQLVDFFKKSAGVNIPIDKEFPPNVKDSLHTVEVIAEDTTPPSQLVKSGLTGILELHGKEAMRGELIGLSRTLTRDEPFDVHLTLDLTGLQVSGTSRLTYKTIIYGRGRGRSGLVVGESEGSIIPTDKATITVKGNTLPEGIYRLAAKVTIGQPDTNLTGKPRILGVIDGGLVQVY